MGAVTIRPFEIRPSVFELKAHQGMMLEVLFVPQTVDSFSFPLVAVCDNCHVQHMQVKGQSMQTVPGQSLLIYRNFVIQRRMPLLDSRR